MSYIIINSTKILANYISKVYNGIVSYDKC